MKKIFTLIGMALVAMSVNAQEAVTESYPVNVDDFNAEEVTLNKTENVTVVANAGKIYKYLDPEVKEVTILDGAWAKANRGDISFDYVYESTKSAVPFITVDVEEFINSNTDKTNYRPIYTYYKPDGSVGLPKNGPYVKLTVKKAGMFKIGFWINKNGGRSLYLVKESDKKALVWNADPSKTEYKIEGYVQSCEEWVDEAAGTKKMVFFNSIPVDENYEVGDKAYQNVPDGKTVDQTTKDKWGWFVFDAVEGETYWIFGSNWQFGFNGYEFTPGASQHDYTGIKDVKTANTVNAAMYNLAGQKVDAGFKGMVIQNGRKFMNK